MSKSLTLHSLCRLLHEHEAGSAYTLQVSGFTVFKAFSILSSSISCIFPTVMYYEQTFCPMVSYSLNLPDSIPGALFSRSLCPLHFLKPTLELDGQRFSSGAGRRSLEALLSVRRVRPSGYCDANSSDDARVTKSFSTA